jgi:acyl transferase domain-containing protein
MEQPEGVAIIGMACRFPGAATVAAFWDNLRNGVESISVFTAEELEEAGVAAARLREARYVKAGAVLSSIDTFDASFFGMSPAEAELLDPQQRLFLECAWEALESAGYNPETYGGSIGVFAGASISTYLLACVQPLLGFAGSADDLQVLIGNDKDYLATRTSYKLNLRGPSITVQTACSTSLVAVHLACQSLLQGECDMALAGGVTVRVPQKTGYRAQEGGVLSPDGHCRAFDAKAQGTVFGSGAGVVVLKRRGEALRDGDLVDAIIKGSAVNNDGSVKVGYTAPSIDGQARVIAEALAAAGVRPEAVGYIEAHGTATPLGDAAEVAALAKIFRATGGGHTCGLGSVKTNVGHLESAAGIAGLIKAVLALKHGWLPPSLHFDEPNPSIPFADTPFGVVTRLTAWPKGPTPRRAGVSSFGIGGTNAHVILEEAAVPEVTPNEASNNSLAYLLCLSARSPQALRDLAGAYRAWLATEGITATMRDVCYTTQLRRKHHEYRLALVSHTPEETGRSLQNYLRGEPQPNLVEGCSLPEWSPRLVFVFPGHGPQWGGMGRQLLRTEPVFREAIKECDIHLKRLASWSLEQELTAEAATSRLDADHIEITQVALFALQVALTALWGRYGVRPGAVVGHSMGEVGAAYAAGALTLEDALAVIFYRSHLLLPATGQGAMAVVELSREEADRELAGYHDRLVIAAENGPRLTVLSGDTEALEEVLQGLEQRNIFFRRLKTAGVAGHSPHMERFRQVLEESLRGLHPRPASVPMVSSVVGRAIVGPELNAAYWGRNLREPVRFGAAIQELITQGYEIFVEIGPHPILGSAILQCLQLLGREGVVLPSLRRQEDERAVLLRSLGALYSHGYAIDWSSLHPHGGRCVRLPTYPWQRQRYWLESTSPQAGRVGGPDRASASRQGHPLLGRHLESALHPGTHFWETTLDLRRLAYLKDHRVAGSVLVPATLWMETALSAACRVFGLGPPVLERVEFATALPLSGDGGKNLQIVIAPEDSDTASFRVASRTTGDPEGQSAWVTHAASVLRMVQPHQLLPPPSSVQCIQARCHQTLSGAELYDRFAGWRVEYGASFQGVEQVWYGDGEALSRLQLPSHLDSEVGVYRIHPALLDAAFQTLMALLPGSTEEVYMPVGVERLRLTGSPSQELWCHAHLGPGEAAEEAVVGDLYLFDREGRPVLEAQGVCLRRQHTSVCWGLEGNFHEWLYQVEWQLQMPLPQTTKTEQRAGPDREKWLLFADRAGVACALRSLLESHGACCVLVSPGETARRLESDHYQINPLRPEDFDHLIGETFAGRLPCRGVVHLWGCDVDPAREDVPAALDAEQALSCGSMLHLVQALGRLGGVEVPRLWLVTRGAQSVGRESTPPVPAQAPLWGLGRVIAHEHPELRCTRIDLEPGTTQSQVAALYCELTGEAAGETEVALRGAARHVARLVPRPPRALSAAAGGPIGGCSASPLRPGATYLITGGLGGLGLTVARELVERGARHLVLVGRTAPRDSAEGTLAALRKGGAEVWVAQADVAEAEEVTRLIRDVEVKGPPLRGIIHAAGVLDDGLLCNQTYARFREVLGPKILGAWNLHCSTRCCELDFLVFFSSAASLLGTPGQGSHAAANAYLDALAHYRRSQGLPALSINWGPWAEVGLASGVDLREQLARRGLESLSHRESLRALLWLLGEKTAQVGVMILLWPRWQLFHPRAAQAPYFSVLAASQGGARRALPPPGDLRQALVTTPPGWQRQALLEAHIREQVSLVLHVASTQIDLDRPLQSLGLDSLRALELRNRLEHSLGLTLSAAIVWRYPTAIALAAHLASRMGILLEPAPETDAGRGGRPPGRVDLAELDQLSEEEAEAWLIRKLTILEKKLLP